MTPTERHRRWARQNAKHLRAYQKRWRAKNKDRIRAWNRKHYKYDYRKTRDKHLRRKYGITLLQYEAMLRRQRGCCAVCRSPRGKGRGGFHADHNHRTKEVRGLLCSNCNLGLGLFGDSSRTLTRAARYLRKFKN